MPLRPILTTVVLLSGFGVLIRPATLQAQTQSPAPYIPSSYYPSGSRITFDPNLSNAGMDAQWNKDYTGAPLMHRYPSTVFLRQTGWMEQGFARRSASTIAWFILFDSNFGTFSNGDGGNLRSFLDLRYMLKHWWGAKLAAHQPNQLVPASRSGEAEARVIPKVGNGPFLVTSVYWGSDQDIEAIAFSAPHFLSRTKLRQMLYAQVRFATTVNPGS